MRNLGTIDKRMLTKENYNTDWKTQKCKFSLNIRREQQAIISKPRILVMKAEWSLTCLPQQQLPPSAAAMLHI